MNFSYVRKIGLTSALLVAAFLSPCLLQAEESIVIARYSSKSTQNPTRFKNKLDNKHLPLKSLTQLFQGFNSPIKKEIKATTAAPSSVSKVRGRVSVKDNASRSVEQDLSQAPLKNPLPSFLLNFLMVNF